MQDPAACANCGTTRPEGARFCATCGLDFEAGEQATEQAAPAATPPPAAPPPAAPPPAAPPPSVEHSITVKTDGFMQLFSKALGVSMGCGCAIIIFAFIIFILFLWILLG
jgi:hypothetical protein